MLTSTFNDTAAPAAPTTGTLEDQAVLFRRMHARDRKPAWVAPAAAVALVGGVAAAALMLTSGPGRQAAPTDMAVAPAATVATTPDRAVAMTETASLSAAVDPAATVPAATQAPARAASAPAQRAAAARPAPERETVTSAPADGPATPPREDAAPSSVTLAPTAPLAITPAPESAVPPAEAAPMESAPADPPSASPTPPVETPAEPVL